MKLINSTDLATDRLRRLFDEQADGWPHRALIVRVGYTKTQDFSGWCDYARKRIHVNVGRSLDYPYGIGTNLARAKSNRRYWWREIYRLRVADVYELAMFVFCHELFHWLVKQAHRNTRQKESMCDRFAARVLVDQFGAAVVDTKGRPVAREVWDFQDLDRFVARARRLTRQELSAVRTRAAACRQTADGQRLLFDKSFHTRREIA